MLSCVAGACSILTDPDGSDSGVTARVSSFPAWSTDGTTVYFSDRKGGGITEIAVKAVDVQSGRVRTLGMIQGLNHAEQLRTTADPASVYATVAHADWSLQLSIHRVPTTGGSLEPVATNVGLPWFVVSNTGNRIAYTGPRYDSDTLFVVDPGRTEGGGVALPAIGTRPVSMGLSPDGTMLVYTSSAGIHVVPTAGGIHRPVWRSAPGEVATLAPQVSWRGTTPRLLIAVDTVLDGTPILELYDLDGETAERVALGTVPRPLVGAHRTQLAWSADGRAYAIWVPVEVVRQNVERTTYRFRLYIREAGTSTARAALELTSDQPLTWFEFSPDGRQVALLLNGSLRVLPVSAP
jgi:Tol biopolymer transport system component